MKPTSTLVIYRDARDSQTMAFGPFVNISIASEFSKALPEPRKGGVKRYLTTQPFTHNEAHMVTDMIMANRERELVAA